MTDMEKKVLMRICTKIVAETELYVTDLEMQNLIDWVCVSGQIKENNNRIRELTGEYKQMESGCREGVREKLERIVGNGIIYLNSRMIKKSGSGGQKKRCNNECRGVAVCAAPYS